MSTVTIAISRRHIKFYTLATGTLALLFAVMVSCKQATTEPVVETTRSGPRMVDESAAGTRLPKLLDLGATKCIPCKMMAPILEELREEYAGKLEVEFIDVWQNPSAADPYGIEQIPTQIFFDASGKELFRHEGFFSKDEILKTWKKYGVDLDK